MRLRDVHPDYFGVAFLVLFTLVGGSFLVWKLTGCEEQTPENAVDRCYGYEEDERLQFEKCICRAVERHGCRKIVDAMPRPHRDVARACCEEGSSE